MNIIFADRKLRSYANNPTLAVRKLGERRAKLFLQRLDDLATALSFADLEYLPGHYHPLKNDRAGQWACDLDQPYRLVFEPADGQISIGQLGKIYLIEIKSVEIVEIINYHKEG